MIDPTARIHPLAHVENATIGARTRVWQFASVIRGTILGADCNVASGATLDGPRFGDRCIICHNVAMGPGFVVSDDVFIGPNVTICNDRWPATHRRGFEPKPGDVFVRIEAGAAIGANAVVLPGVVIGEGAMVGAGAVASRDVPPGHVLWRDGTVAPISPGWRERRLRLAC